MLCSTFHLNDNVTHHNLLPFAGTIAMSIFLNCRHYCYAYGQAIVDVRRQYLVKKNVCDSTEDKVLPPQYQFCLFLTPIMDCPVADLVQGGALLWRTNFHPTPRWNLRGWRGSPRDRPRRRHPAQLPPPPWRAVFRDPGRGPSWNFYPYVHPRQLVWRDLLVFIFLCPFLHVSHSSTK